MANEIVAEVEYREIPGYEGYRIGSDGTIWSRRNKGGQGSGLTDDWRQLKILYRPNGYPFFTVTKLGDAKNTRKKLALHRLMLEVFVGPCPDGMESCHANGVKSDIRLENLRWDTKKNNHADRHKHGTVPMGQTHYKARLTEDQVREIRSIDLSKKGLSKETADRFGISKSTVSAIVHRRIWKHVA